MVSGTFHVERRAVRYVVDFLAGVGLDDLVATGFPVQTTERRTSRSSPSSSAQPEGLNAASSSSRAMVTLNVGTDPDLLDVWTRCFVLREYSVCVGADSFSAANVSIEPLPWRA
jgi:hypothetical protein